MSKPPIFLLVVDSLRADHLGCYGYGRETSPNLDRMAQEGVKFDDFFTNSYWSIPSHASLYSGELPSDHRVLFRPEPYFSQKNRLAGSLREQGYFTYGNSNNHWINDFYGFEKGFDEFDYQMWNSPMKDEEAKELLREIQSKDWDSTKQKYLATVRKTARSPEKLFRLMKFKFENSIGQRLGLNDKGSAKSLETLEKKLEHHDTIFGFCNLMEVHAPYIPPIGFKRKYSSKRLPEEGVTDASKEASGENLQERIDLYDDCIRFIDSQIGEFVDKVSSTHPETVFMITSDHGELFYDNSPEFEEEKQAHNASISDEILKVPMIVYSKETDLSMLETDGSVSLREVPEIISSIVQGKKFESKGWIIAESISSKNASSQMITDSENEAIARSESVYRIGDIDQCRELEEKLDQKTDEIAALESMKDEEEIIENLEF